MRLQSKLMCGGQETATELDLGIDIVHECFTERGDSAFSVVSCYECSYRTNEFIG